MEHEMFLIKDIFPKKIQIKERTLHQHDYLELVIRI